MQLPGIAHGTAPKNASTLKTKCMTIPVTGMLHPAIGIVDPIDLKALVTGMRGRVIGIVGQVVNMTVNLAIGTETSTGSQHTVMVTSIEEMNMLVSIKRCLQKREVATIGRQTDSSATEKNIVNMHMILISLA